MHEAQSATRCKSFSIGNAADEAAGGVVRFQGFGEAGPHKHVMSEMTSLDGDGNTRFARYSNTYVGGTGVLDGIQFLMGLGDIAAGAFELFGIKGA